MKTVTFILSTGNYTTGNKAEIKMLKACGNRIVKTPKQTFAKGLESGNPFLN